MTIHRKHHHNSHKNDFDLAADFENIKALLADTSHDVRGRANQLLQQSLDTAREKSAAMKEDASEYVSERPFKAVGIAALAGIILGYFLHK